MKYIRSQKYNIPELQAKIMGPNPVKLEEELLLHCKISPNAIVCDLGSGQGLTSLFLVKEYGFTVYATDLWSDPEDNRKFFRKMGLSDEQIIPVKASVRIPIIILGEILNSLTINCSHILNMVAIFILPFPE